MQSQLAQVREWLLSDDRVQEQYERLEKLNPAAHTDPYWKEFFKRRFRELSHVLSCMSNLLLPV